MNPFVRRPGMILDQAIGTTFSLDLMTLLTVPLAFALRDIEDDDGGPMQDPLALLEAIRRYAERTHIFCQAGGIYLPRGNKLFLSHLEVGSSRGHGPKNWWYLPSEGLGPAFCVPVRGRSGASIGCSC